MEEKDIAMFLCMCGASFVGTEADYDQHLELYCPVYAQALKTLRKKHESVIHTKDDKCL